MAHDRRVLAIIGGGVAAYKALETIRLLQNTGIETRAVLTRAGGEFVTPLSVGALTGHKVHQELFDLTDEAEMGHIQLSRSADALLIVPATADLIAKMAHGQADDLASTVLLATDAPVVAVPAMNVRMWNHPATQANVNILKSRGVHFIGPAEGEMACGEFGLGRLVEASEIAVTMDIFLHLHGRKSGRPWSTERTPLAGHTALVTSGPTHEPIDPVRYLANRSSGRQGHAIAGALALLGAQVTLVSGPTRLGRPPGANMIDVESAAQMRDACRAALPCDVAIFAAAVADWRPSVVSGEKLKKTDALPSAIALTTNADILAEISDLKKNRPKLVIGFAAETVDVSTNATRKRAAKGCDWILANDVSPESGTFGGSRNRVIVIDGAQPEHWPAMDKTAVAARLAHRIAQALTGDGRP